MKKLQRILEWVIAFLMFLSGRNVEKWRGKYEENRFDCDSLLGNERRPVFYGVRSGCLPSQAGIQRAGIPLLYPEGRADCVYPSGGEDRGACQGAQCDEYRYLLLRLAGCEGPSQGYPDGVAGTFDAGVGENVIETVSRQPCVWPPGSESGPERQWGDRARGMDKAVSVF